MYKFFLAFNRFLRRILCKMIQGTIIRIRDLIDAAVSRRLVNAMRGSRSRSRSRGPSLNGPRVVLWTSANNLTLRIKTPRRLFISGGVVCF